MTKFEFEVSAEDHALLQSLKDAGATIRISLDPDAGGISVESAGTGRSLQWLFISEIDYAEGTFDSPDAAVNWMLEE